MTNERYIHFSASPLRAVHSIAQEQPDGEPFHKPRGLWFSVEGGNDWADDGWKWWCEAEGFRPQDLAFQTELRFAPTARIKRLSSPEDIDQFTTDYLVDYPAFRHMRIMRGYVMDWSKLAQDYDAIIIAPYQWERRMGEHCFWYYTWDCASGCVWNADAIASLMPLQEKVND